MRKARVIQFWDQVRKGLLETVEKFSDEELDFIAYEGGFSVREIMLHIAQEEYGEVRYGITRDIDEFPPPYREESYPTIDSIKALMPAIHLGFVLPTESRDKQRRPALVGDLNRALDLIAGHFDSAWMVDHLQFGDIDVLEGFTALTYLCALHPRLRFGNAVLCQSFRNPALLAKMVATLQFMSGGRFILGLGAGWHEEEYKAYGYEFPSGLERVEQLEEAVQIIRRMWSQETATF